jgi:hypothetical protein
LFGQRFIAIGKVTGGQKLGQKAGWSVHNPNSSPEQQKRWEYVTRPILALLRLGGGMWEELTEVGGAEWAGAGAGAGKVREDWVETVDADYLCFIVGELAEIQRTKSFQYVCVVDCRCMIAALYGGKLLRPMQLEM